MGTIPLFSQEQPFFDIQGHRGARGLQPENTIPAFLAALDAGATTVEMDVVMTRDRQIVVSHEPWMSASLCLDSSGNRIAPEREKEFNIYRMTYAQVRRFDCGSIQNLAYPEQKSFSVSKPLLRDVIVAVENHIKNTMRHEVDYSIEIKATESGNGVFHPTLSVFSDGLYDLINQYLPLERVIIQSFEPIVLRYWHEKYPTVRLAALVECPCTAQQYLGELGFTPAIYSPNYSLLNASEMHYLSKKNMRVIPWTVNKPSEMVKLKKMGVDGLITDYPNRAVQLFSLPPNPDTTGVVR